MDNHDGTGIPGKDNGSAADAQQPAGQRRASGPAPKRAPKTGKAAAARPRKTAQAPAPGKGASAGKPGKAAASSAVPDGQAAASQPSGKGEVVTAEESAQAPAPAEGAQAKGTPAAEAPVKDAATGGPEEAVAAASTVKAGQGAAAEGQATPAETAPTAEAPAAPAVKGRKVAGSAGTKAVPAKKAAPGKKATPARKAATGTAAKQAAPARKAAGDAKTATAEPVPQQSRATAAAAKVSEKAKGAAPTAPEAAPWQLTGYVPERELGAGAFGRVVRARHEASGVPVTITYLSAELAQDAAFREAFRSEADKLGGLESPYVTRLHAYVEDGPHAAVVTEPVDGVGLDVLLREHGPLAPEAALAVLKGSLLGLAAAHWAGVVHRAYEPANVLVTPEGTVKLGGVGLASRAEGGTEGGTPAGAPSYAAPELLAGAPATPASDLYAAAAVFFTGLTGTPPYAGTDAAEPAAPDARQPGEQPRDTPDVVAKVGTAAAAAEPAAQHTEARIPAAQDPGEQPQDTPDVVAEAGTAAAAAEPAAQHINAPAPYAQVPEPVRPLVARGLAEEPGGRPQGATDFVAEVDTVAAAAYGADWEERGQRQLAALVVPLPAAPRALVAPAAGAGGTPPPPEPAGDAGSRAPRFGRRAKVLAAAVAGVIVVGAVAISAVASGSDKSTTTADPSPTATTARPSAAAPVATSPSAVTTTATPSASPSPSSTPPTTGGASTPPAAPTTLPPATPTTVAATATAPATPSAHPTRAVPPVSGGPHVGSVAVTGFTCSTGNRTATATVSVHYDGTASGTLLLTWWRNSAATPQGATTMPRQTARFPKGSQTYTFTDTFTFAKDHSRPYIGLTVATSPSAASGNGSYRVGCH